ncbi:putative uncharacterized transposon-derived protein F52C9.6 [Varanus komodoensis]|nr:putative uncharacterized transposon-derived protein F52C9.6 [Varanus komodoensis]
MEEGIPLEHIMRKAGLDGSPVGIKRNIHNLRYADDATLMAESEEELKSLLMRVKEESAKVGLKLNIKKTKVMASGPEDEAQILWPPDEKDGLPGEEPDAGDDGGQKKKGQQRMRWLDGVTEAVGVILGQVLGGLVPPPAQFKVFLSRQSISRGPFPHPREVHPVPCPKPTGKNPGALVEEPEAFLPTPHLEPVVHLGNPLFPAWLLSAPQQGSPTTACRHLFPVALDGHALPLPLLHWPLATSVPMLGICPGDTVHSLEVLLDLGLSLEYQACKAMDVLRPSLWSGPVQQLEQLEAVSEAAHLWVGDKRLESSTCERDLGVLVDCRLNMSQLSDMEGVQRRMGASQQWESVFRNIFITLKIALQHTINCSIIGLVIIHRKRRSSPAAKWSSCEADLYNQTCKKPAQTARLEKCSDVLEEAQRSYQEENDKLSVLLAQADRSMTDLQIHLHACQMQLKNLEDNVTAGVAEASIHEVEKRIILEEELMHLKRQLKEQRCGSSESNIWRLPSSRGQACAMDTNIPFQWGTRKTWMAVSAVELAIIFILGAGLAHLIVHRPHEQEDMERWPESNVLSSLISVNRTLQIATKSCQDQTRTLEANTTSLNSEVARLNARLRLHALEKAALQDQLTILKNWTQLFQDLKDQQKTIIGHFQKDQDLDQDPNPDHGHLSGHGPFIYLHAGLASLALAVLLCV